jgi:hypothetical protein
MGVGRSDENGSRVPGGWHFGHGAVDEEWKVCLWEENQFRMEKHKMILCY